MSLKFQLLVEATRVAVSTQTATCTVDITVTRNENGPIFQYPFGRTDYIVTIVDTTVEGTVIETVSATDLDGVCCWCGCVCLRSWGDDDHVVDVYATDLDRVCRCGCVCNRSLQGMLLVWMCLQLILNGYVVAVDVCNVSWGGIQVLVLFYCVSD